MSVYYKISVIFCACLLFLVTNRYLDGYMNSPIELAREIQSPPDSLPEYLLFKTAPFKYRIGFPEIVKESHELAAKVFGHSDYFSVYVFWSLLFYSCSALLFFNLLNSAGFGNQLSAVGVFLYLLMPAMLLAFTIPVHTREDTLAYCLLWIGLIYLAKDNQPMVLVISILGVLVRETLLLIPLLYLFFGKHGVFNRIWTFLIPVGIWLAIRWALWEPYDWALGFRWNIGNPLQVFGFLFLTFNILWPLWLLSSIKSPADGNPIKNYLRRTNFFVLAVLLVTTLIGGIFNEIRLLYLFAPWMVVLALDAIVEQLPLLRQIIFSRGYVVYCLVLIATLAIAIRAVGPYLERELGTGKYAVPYGTWVIFIIIYLALFLFMVPPYLKMFANLVGKNRT